MNIYFTLSGRYMFRLVAIIHHARAEKCDNETLGDFACRYLLMQNNSAVTGPEQQESGARNPLGGGRHSPYPVQTGSQPTKPTKGTLSFS